MQVPPSELTTAESGLSTETDAKHPSSDQNEYIYVSDNFKVKEGARLTENLKVGKPLGVGLQVRLSLLRSKDRMHIGKSRLAVDLRQGGVFLLEDNAGNTDPNQVLKAVFKFGIGGLFGMTNLEREWRVGRQLALLTQPGEALPGFMGTGAGIVTKSGKFRGTLIIQCFDIVTSLTSTTLLYCIVDALRSLAKACLGHACLHGVPSCYPPNSWCVFAAMILERIVGRDITKPINAKEFHDVHYLRQMLFCVFKSLHKAQRKLAFHHADLRLANIMELMPDDSVKGGKTGATSTASIPRSGSLQAASHHDTQHVAQALDPDQLTAVGLPGAGGEQHAAATSANVYQSDTQATSTETSDHVFEHQASHPHGSIDHNTSDLQAGNFKVSSLPM